MGLLKFRVTSGQHAPRPKQEMGRPSMSVGEILIATADLLKLEEVARGAERSYTNHVSSTMTNDAHSRQLAIEAGDAEDALDRAEIKYRAAARSIGIQHDGLNRRQLIDKVLRHAAQVPA